MTGYKTLFRDILFIKIFFSINLVTLSQAFVNISIIWLIYGETKDPLLVAGFGMLMQIPQLLFGSIVARLLDRIVIQKAMSFLLTIRATIFFLIFLLPFDNVIFLYVIAFLLCINSMLGPAVSSGTNVIVANVVDRDSLVSANALLTIFFDISYIFSSIAVAVLTYLSNNRLAFLISAVLLLVAAIVVVSIQTKDSPSVKKNENQKNKDSFIESAKYIFMTKNIFIIVLLTIIWNMFTWGTFSTLLPIYVENNLNKSNIAFGLLNSMQSVGIIISSVVLGANLLKNLSIEKIICWGIILHCSFLIGFSFSYNLALSALLLIFSGMASAPVLVYKSTYFQREIPREIMGQVFSIITIISSFMYPFGSGIVAFILKFIGKENFNSVNLIILVSLIGISGVGWKIVDSKK